MIVTQSDNEKISKRPSSASQVTKPLFTGEALFTVETVNPTKDEIIELKDLQNIANMVKEPQYLNIQRGNDVFTKIEFVLSFNPNKLLGVTGKYPDKLFVEYRVYINDRINISKDSSKVQVIDSHKNSAWVSYTKDKTPAECLADEIAKKSKISPDKIGYLTKLDSKTVRFAKNGEVVLYDFLFNMTTLSIHNPERGNSLENFVIGDSVEKASEAFSALVKGDFSLVNEWIGNANICAYDDGTIAQVGGLLGVVVDNNQGVQKFYQEIFADRFTCSTFRETARARRKGDDNVSMTRIPKEAFKRLVDETNPWRAYWNNDAKLQEFNPLTYQNPVTEVIEDAEIEDDIFGDLPF